MTGRPSAWKAGPATSCLSGTLFLTTRYHSSTKPGERPLEKVLLGPAEAYSTNAGCAGQTSASGAQAVPPERAVVAATPAMRAPSMPAVDGASSAGPWRRARVELRPTARPIDAGSGLRAVVVRATARRRQTKARHRLGTIVVATTTQRRQPDAWARLRTIVVATPPGTAAAFPSAPAVGRAAGAVTRGGRGGGRLAAGRSRGQRPSGSDQRTGEDDQAGEG